MSEQTPAIETREEAQKRIADEIERFYQTFGVPKAETPAVIAKETPQLEISHQAGEPLQPPKAIALPEVDKAPAQPVPADPLPPTEAQPPKASEKLPEPPKKAEENPIDLKDKVVSKEEILQSASPKELLNALKVQAVSWWNRK